MLADGVEAASRSMEKPNAARIEALVKDIIDRRFKGDQLSECNLTFKDLSTISAVFVKILLGILHPRVKYPQEEAVPGNGKENSEKHEKILQEQPKSDSDKPIRS